MGILLTIVTIYAFIKCYINFGIPKTAIFLAIILFIKFILPLFGFHWLVPFILSTLTLIVMLMMIRYTEAG